MITKELIGENTYYYEEKFKLVDEGKLTFNICAFLFTGLWLVYRKLYLEFAAFLFLVAANAVFFAFIGNDGFASEIIPLALYVAGGLFGNNLYKNHLEKIAERYPGDNKKGGVNLPATIGIFIIVLAMYIATNWLCI